MTARTLLLALSLSACAAPPASDAALSSPAAPPPTEVLTLTAPGALVLGRPATLTVSPVTPGTPVALVASDAEGGRPWCPRPIAPTCLALPRGAVLAGVAVADTTGTATFTVTAPLELLAPRGRLQAVAPTRRGAVTSPVSTVDLVRPGHDLRPGSLLVTEVHVDPAACDDRSGEFVELLYLHEQPADLDGLVVSDLTGSAVLSPRVVRGGELVVLARDAAAFTACYGVPPHARTGLALGNTGDAITVSSNHGPLDTVDWRGWPITPGVSWSLDGQELRTWCPASLRASSGDLASPGALNGACTADTAAPVDSGQPLLALADLAPGDLRIVEILPDPAGCPDDDGEYVELRYEGPGPVDLAGLVIADDLHATTIDEATVLQPGDRVLSARDAAALPGCTGVTPLLEHRFALDARGDVLRLLDPAGRVLDEVDFRGWTTPAGTAWELDDDGTRWCLADTPWRGGPDLGSPGLPNGPCPRVHP